MAIAFLIIISFFIYFLPLLIAGLRGHSNSVSIGLLNLFLGWTLIGWVAALVWSCTSQAAPQVVVVNRGPFIQ
jgi:hypothetical protein